MGRRDKKYRKTLNEQAYDRFTEMLCFGQSKRKDQMKGETDGRIYSFRTYKVYRRHCRNFLIFVKDMDPDASTLEHAKKWIPAYLQRKAEEGCSAYTLTSYRTALNKLYGIRETDAEYIRLPKRRRADITKNRGEPRIKEEERARFCKACGLRKRELLALTGGAFFTREELELQKRRLLEKGEDCNETEKKELLDLESALRFRENGFLYVKNGKGGRARYTPILEEEYGFISEQMKRAGDGKLWKKPDIIEQMSVHCYRGEYAESIYLRYADDVKTIHRNEGALSKNLYRCIKDMKGTVFDRRALFFVSAALGHNRENVAAMNYLYRLKEHPMCRLEYLPKSEEKCAKS